MRKIVIVDDEYVVSEGLRKLVDWARYDACVVGSAADGAEGLELITRENPDIVFTDIRMPVMNGLSMIDAAIRRGCESIFIVFSGYSEFSYAQQALSLGVISYIEKPVTVGQIEEVMEKALRILEEKGAPAAAAGYEWQGAQSGFGRQLAENTRRIRLAVQKADRDEVLDCLRERFSVLRQGDASPSIFAHEALRLFYIALGETAESEADFVREVMNGVPPYAELSRISGKENIEAWIRGRLLDVLAWLTERTRAQKHSAIESAVEYLNAHYTEPVTLQQLADIVHINAAYLSTLFKKEMGISYVRYLTDLRLAEARNRLLEGERVSIVGQEVGFRDIRHFTKLYKQKYGVTPDAVKNRRH